MKAIILAAGSGTRLLPQTKETPKCLLDISGKAILDYQLNVLRKCGITDIAIVTGFQNEKIKNHLKNTSVSFIHNDDYKTTNNAYSLWLARDFVHGDTEGFIVINSDLLFQSAMLQTILDAPIADGMIIEQTVNPASDMVKITMEETKIIHMSKQIPPDQAHAEAVGPVKFSVEGGKRFMEHIERAIDGGDKMNWFFYTISDYAKEYPFFGVPNPQHLWAEVDTPEDLELARKIIPTDFE